MSCFGSSRQGCVSTYYADDLMAPPRPSLSASRPSTPKITLRVAFNRSPSSSDKVVERQVPVRDAKFYRQLEKAKDQREASIKRKRASHPHLRAEYRDDSPPPLPTSEAPPSPTSSISSISSQQPARKRLLRKRSEPVLAARTVAAVGGAITHFEELPPVPKIPAIFWPREQTITVMRARLITCS